MVDYKDIDPKDLQRMFLDKDKVLVVDVRSKEEFEEAHIEGAVNIPLPKLTQEKLQTLCKEMDADRVVMQCRSGVRSKSAINELNDKFSCETYNLKGGLTAWATAGYKIVVED